MTTKEKVICTAYTGISFGETVEFHKYAEEKLGRPIQSLEFGFEYFWEELKKATKEDFIKMLEEK